MQQPRSAHNAAVAGTRLTETALAEHNKKEESKCDSKHVETRIREEASQDYWRALHNWVPHDSCCPDEGLASIFKSNTNSSSHLSDYVSMIDADKISRFSIPSTASPMDRFATLSTSDHPFPLKARLAMDAIGLAHGSLETLEIRFEMTKKLVEDAEANKIYGDFSHCEEQGSA